MGCSGRGVVKAADPPLTSLDARGEPINRVRALFLERNPGVWLGHGGYLLLYGSIFHGEAHVPAKGTSCSDVDFLWTGEGEPPRAEDLGDIVSRLAGRNGVDGFGHVGLKTGLSHSKPAWMLNAWVPALRHHVKATPELANLLPAELLHFRGLSPGDAALAFDFAWRYAAFSLAGTRRIGTRAVYGIAKLHLLLARLKLQLEGCFPASYSDAVDKVSMGCSSELAACLQRSLCVKLGRVSDPSVLRWLDAWRAAQLLSLSLRDESGLELGVKELGLVTALCRWAEVVHQRADPHDAHLRRCAARVAEAIGYRICTLPDFETGKKPQYEQYMRAWLWKN
jgi:hypothetical protein